jgi:phospholipase A-2-activating protein
MKSDSTTTSNDADLLDDYVLSKSYVSADGEAVRSMCLMESSVVSTDEDNSTSTLLVVGSQGGWITTYSAATTIATTTIEPVHSFQGGHSHAITALISYEMDTFVSGCKDAIIRVFRLSCATTTTNDGISSSATNTPSSITQLVGHTNAVTSFSLVYFTPTSSSTSTSTKPFLLSGSWDGTAKLWNDSTCLTTLEGHENTVCVQGLPPSTYTNHYKNSHNNSDTNRQYYFATVATGSAGIAYGNVISEMKVRLWDLTLVALLTANNNTQPTYSCTATLRTYITDHLGPIRGLSYNPTNHYLVSISNDGSMKLRDSSTGTTLQSFQHSATTNTSTDIPPLLLTVTTIGHNTFVTGTEDGYAYIWNTNDSNTKNNNTPQQIILHPNTIWQVLPFSAPTDTHAAHAGEDFMTACHDGYVRVFTKSVQRMASPEEIHTFTTQVETAAAARSGSSSSSGGGGPSREEILKLPHWENRYQKTGKSEGQIQLFQRLQPEGDDNEPYAIAAQWCSGTWIEVGQVVGSNQSTNQQPQKKEMIDGTQYDYVIPIEVDTPTSGTLHLQIGYNAGDNPFVVAQQFIDQHQLNQHYLAQIADYIRERTAPKKPTMLGDTSHVVHQQEQAEQHAEKPKTSSSSLEYLPMKSFLFFDSGTDKTTMNKIFSKLKEIHVDVVSSSSSGSSNDNKDLIVLERLVTTIGATNRYHASTISKEELTLLSRWISTWPLEYVFPVLDLIRLVVLHPDASNVQNVHFWQGGGW